MTKITYSLINTIRRIFRKHKHHAVYDKKWCHWYCSKCNRELYYNDLPPKVWKHLMQKSRRVKRH